jgi:hypothetical protein
MAIRKLVILVAGHGGGDPGSLGQGTTEANETIQIVDRAYNMFAAHPNILVEKAPHADDYVASTNWINANYKNLDDGVIVEVHKNKTAGATGIETFTGLGPDDTTVRLATLVNNGIVATTGLRNRGVKQGGFYLITATNQRAVLAECGFMDDDPLNDDADEKYARGIYNGVCDFFGEARVAAPTPAPTPAPAPVVTPPKPAPAPAPAPVVIPPVTTVPLPCGQPTYTETDRVRDNKTASIVESLWNAIKKIFNIT